MSIGELIPLSDIHAKLNVSNIVTNKKHIAIAIATANLFFFILFSYSICRSWLGAITYANLFHIVIKEYTVIVQGQATARFFVHVAFNELYVVGDI